MNVTPFFPARRTPQRPVADPAISFEFFPPKSAEATPGFWHTVSRLAELLPTFCSVTYGAGGATMRETGAIAAGIEDRCGLRAAAHLTCVDATRAETDAVADGYWQSGIRHVVALRGDARAASARAGAGSAYCPDPAGYAYADALVAGLVRLHPFEISVAAYPEVHPQARSAGDDLDHLKRKLDAGATRAITQFCFDLVAFERFLERCARAGITIPIIAGILPISNFTRLETLAALCGARLPPDLRAACAGIDADPARRHYFAVRQAVALCEALQSLGVDAFHFYTLNRAELVLDICAALDIATSAERPVSRMT